MSIKYINIPEDALETTIQVCSCELEKVYEKQHHSYKETLLRFLCMDFRLYMKISLIGLCIMMFVRLLIPNTNGRPFIIYFAMLGCLNIKECYKIRNYHMEELCGPVYLNQGRVFLFKNACMALFELILFFVFVIVDEFVLNIQVVSIMLGGLLPLLCIQILLLHVSKYIQQMSVSCVLYLLLLILYGLLYNRFEGYVLAHISVVGACCLCILIIAFLFFDIWYLSFNRKEKDYGTTVKTY